MGDGADEDLLGLGEGADEDLLGLGESADDPGSSSSFLDDVLLSEGPEGDGDDAEADGLELDDSQAVEIRRIFLTSLPQYVLPVEQLVEQLLAAPEPNPEVHRTLLTTLASIAEAAERLGIEDARECIERMHVHVEAFGAGGDASEELARAIAADLEAVKRIGSDESDGSQPTGTPTRTLVSAFQNVDDVDASLLEQLTAAGLVTVDQLEQAEPAEIAAVTGLDAAVVDRLLSALGVAPRARRARKDAPGSAPPSGGSPPRRIEGRLGDELGRHLYARVEAEVALEEARVRVRRLRGRLQSMTRALDRATRRRDEISGELARSEKRLERSLRARSEAREARDRAQTEKESLQEALGVVQGRIPDLTRRRKDVRTEHESLSDTVAALSMKAENLLAAARRVEAEQASRASSAYIYANKRRA